MNKYTIKIKKINIQDNLLKIISIDNIIFTSKIIKGCITFKIYNNMNDEISLQNIEENDIIKIYGYPNYISKEKNIINNILIKKIKINNKYDFIITESSDQEYF